MSLLQEYYTRFPDQRKAHMTSLHDHKFLPSSDEAISADQQQYGVSPEVKGAEVLTLLRKGTWEEPEAPGEEAWPCSWPPVTQFPKAPRHVASSNNIEQAIPRQRATAARQVPAKIDSDYDYASPSASPSPMAGSGFTSESPSSGHKEKDKEWAALTTWLRMNLHQPRTVKRKVLFVGTQPDDDEEWVFDLNEAITWDDVSIDTKTRLKTLVEETEAAFAQKYPNRRVSDWKYKIQKYRLPGGSKTHLVPLADVVYSLQDIYNRHAAGGGGDSADGPAGMDMDDDSDGAETGHPGPPMMSSSLPVSSHNWGGRAAVSSRGMRRTASHAGFGDDAMDE